MKFHKTSLKLAGFYLAILMIISLFFSGVIYQTSVYELQRGLQRPVPGFGRGVDNNLIELFREELNNQRLAAFEEAKQRLLTRLLFINLLILAGGGLLSYYLALRTLRPIEEAHERQSRFTADASHELRTPITAMRSEIEVALMDPKLSVKEAKEQLRSNLEELEKLTALTEGLLRLSHLDNTGLQMAPVAADIIATRAVERVASSAKSKKIKLNTDVMNNTPVMAEEINATEALVTLLDNAIKYSPVESEVSLRTELHQKNMHFIVTDEGSGIAADELPHIFDRFYRADSSRTKQRTEGYGLGLAIAKGVAEAHDGSIKVTSSPEKGSSFTLVLPIA